MNQRYRSVTMLVVLASLVLVSIVHADPVIPGTTASCRFSKTAYSYGETVVIIISTSTGIWEAYIIVTKPDGSSNIVTFGKITPGTHTISLGTAGAPPGYRRCVLKDRQYGDRVLSESGYYAETTTILSFPISIFVPVAAVVAALVAVLVIALLMFRKKKSTIRKTADVPVQMIAQPTPQQQQQPAATVEQKEDPISILKLRYAKGEITKEEYEQAKKTLEED